MRERRVFMMLGIVLAVFVLGIAYAAVSRELEIKGNATGTFDPSNFQVKFSEVSEVTGTKGVNTTGSTATIDSVDKTKGTFSFNGFTTKGQTQSATWTISNDNNAELYAQIEMNTDTEINKEYFRATCNLADDVIAPNETTTVTVTVECIKTPEGNVNSGEITFGFTATSSHEGKELITFTIDGNEYQVKEGTTWGDIIGMEIFAGLAIAVNMYGEICIDMDYSIIIVSADGNYKCEPVSEICPGCAYTLVNR